MWGGYRMGGLMERGVHVMCVWDSTMSQAFCCVRGVVGRGHGAVRGCQGMKQKKETSSRSTKLAKQ